MQAAGDHQVKNEPDIAFQADGDAFADAAEFADDEAMGIGEWRLGGAEKKRGGDSNADERLREDAGFKCGEVGGDVGEFRHGIRLQGEGGILQLG